METQQRNIAVITGATSGIGEAFARACAVLGHDLIITGRRREKIDAVADSIRRRLGVAVEVVIAELADADDRSRLAEKVNALENLSILVNNAGFAENGPFFEQDLSRQRDMLRVHADATMELTHAALPGMIQTGEGAVINVSSLGGLIPFPHNAVYSGSKAFVLFFTESIHLELRGTGVKVQALCPGMTVTDFHEKMGFEPEKLYTSSGMRRAMSADEVVETSFAYLKKDRPICIPGRNNRTTYLLTRLLPRKLLYSLISSSLRK
jgi:short-subunit dehydrogenase